MSAATNNNKIPKDAQIIEAILKELGIQEFDPRVVQQLLEFVYCHTTTVLDEARIFADFANKKNIDADDVRLAIEMQSLQMNSSGPPRDVLLELARVKNSVALAPVKPQSGLRLPPDRFCLTQTNYQMKKNMSTAGKKQSTFKSGTGSRATAKNSKNSSPSVPKAVSTIPSDISAPSTNENLNLSNVGMMDVLSALVQESQNENANQEFKLPVETGVKVELDSKNDDDDGMIDIGPLSDQPTF